MLSDIALMLYAIAFYILTFQVRIPRYVIFMVGISTPFLIFYPFALVAQIAERGSYKAKGEDASSSGCISLSRNNHLKYKERSQKTFLD